MQRVGASPGDDKRGLRRTHSNPAYPEVPRTGNREGRGPGSHGSFRQASLDYTVQFTICRATPDTLVGPPGPLRALRVLGGAWLLYPSRGSWVLILAEFREGRVSAMGTRALASACMVPATFGESLCRWSGCIESALACNKLSDTGWPCPCCAPPFPQAMTTRFHLLRCNVLNASLRRHTAWYCVVASVRVLRASRGQHASAASFSSPHASAGPFRAVTQTSRKPPLPRLLHGRHGLPLAEVRHTQRWNRHDARRILFRVFLASSVSPTQ